jgi:polysaccharide export outer membrane protein
MSSNANGISFAFQLSNCKKILFILWGVGYGGRFTIAMRRDVGGLMPHTRNSGVLGVLARAATLFAPAALAGTISLMPSLGQQPTLQQLQQLQQQQNQRTMGGAYTETTTPSTIVLTPESIQARARLPVSRLEQIMSQRAGTLLQQFGYEQLGLGRTVTVSQTGAVQDDYVLGVGDEMVISLRGTESNDFRIIIDRNGQALLPRLSPIPAMGRSFASFRQDVEEAVRRAYVGTSAFVSVGRVRQITVLVSGEVNNPGLRLVTGLSSVVDALLLSDGVRKTGSLRNIRIQRGNRELVVDLYTVLTTNRNNAALLLADGDRILVPLLGPTVAVSGLVRQSSIFELPARQASITVSNLLQLAGGQEVRGLYRMSIMRIEADGRSNLVAAQDPSTAVRDSEILFVQLAANQVVNQATLSGGSGLAGTYALGGTSRLSELLRAPGAMGESPYSLFGLIVRRDSQSLMRTLASITPVAVMAGREDMVLRSDDQVRVFSMGEVRLLDFVMRSYLRGLVEADARLRNPLRNSAESEMGEQAFAAARRETERDLQLAFVQSYIFNVPSETQRSTIIKLLDTPAPGTDAARQFAMRNANQVNQSNPAVPAVPVTNGPAGQMAGGQPDQQTMGAQDSYAARARNSLAGNFQNTATGSDRVADNREIQTFQELVRQLDVDALVLINFLVENRARLEGAVRGPGDYLVGPSTTLNDLVQAAGGTMNWSDHNGVELIGTMLDRESGKGATLRRNLPLSTANLASYMVRPSDQFRFAQISAGPVGSVTVQGEVRNPGTFVVLRGDRLSDVLARAGGLTEVAYPVGTVYLRQSVAQQEHESYQRAAREVQEQLMVAMTRIGNSRVEPTTFASLQAFVTELRQQKPLGRISVVADPSILASRPEMDPLLETGDVIYVPQRPSTISVLGQVLQPGSYPYSRVESVGDYIQRAGGYARTADESQTYLVLPDGSARRWERSWFRFDVAALPPGSAIVVPRDVTPLDLRQTIIDVTQILSQLAVSIASVAVISK